jgi:hypothetical protein
VQGAQQGGALGEQGDAEDYEAGHIAVVGVLRAAGQRVEALEDGEAAAHDEDADGGEQGPEEAFLAVAEGVTAVRRAAAAAQRGEEEDLVEAVGDRVRGLGEEGRGSGEQSSDGLGDGDHEVRAERDQDGDAGPAVGAVRAAPPRGRLAQLGRTAPEPLPPVGPCAARAVRSGLRPFEPRPVRVARCVFWPFEHRSVPIARCVFPPFEHRSVPIARCTLRPPEPLPVPIARCALRSVGP